MLTLEGKRVEGRLMVGDNHFPRTPLNKESEVHCHLLASPELDEDGGFVNRVELFRTSF